MAVIEMAGMSVCDEQVGLMAAKDADYSAGMPVISDITMDRNRESVALSLICEIGCYPFW